MAPWAAAVTDALESIVGKGADRTPEPFVVAGPLCESGDVFTRALESMAPFGRMVCIGASSGEAQRIPGVGDLRVRGVGVLPFSMGAFRARHPEQFLKTSAEGIELIRSGALRPPVGQVLPLAEAAEAHRRLGSRATTGKLLLAVG